MIFPHLIRTMRDEDFSLFSREEGPQMKRKRSTEEQILSIVHA